MSKDITPSTFDESLEDIFRRVRAGMIGQDVFKSRVKQLVAREEIVAFKHGLITGALPEALGKPIAEDYLKQHKALGIEQTNKEKL